MNQPVARVEGGDYVLPELRGSINPGAEWRNKIAGEEATLGSCVHVKIFYAEAFEEVSGICTRHLDSGREWVKAWDFAVVYIGALRERERDDQLSMFSLLYFPFKVSCLSLNTCVFGKIMQLICHQTEGS